MKQALKKDVNKPDLSHLSLETAVLLSRVRMFGTLKYARDDWKFGFKITRSLAATLRHILKFLSGRSFDEESGLLELGHAMASLEHAIYDFIHHPELDDRKEKNNTEDLIALIDKAIHNPDAILPQYKLSPDEKKKDNG